MADVFVSYATPDRQRVAPIVAALEADGWSVWWDRAISGGAAFDRAIEQAIDEARCVVVVWSEQSVESEWVRTEANEGLERGVLVPVAIDAVRPPLAFRRTQTLDFTAQPDFPALIDAVAGYTPRAKTARPQSAIVGRDLEVEKISNALAHAAKGLGSLLLISGEAGVGKTRLTREAATRARALDMLALTGHCAEMEGAPPYEPFVEHIEQAVRTVDPVGLRAALGENAPEVAKLMPELRQLYTDIPQPIELPPDQDRRYLLHGFGDFLERSVANQPLLLIFEDLHWADDSTCIMLRHLAERLRDCGVVLLGTYRDNELAPSSPFARTLQELVRERLSEGIQLRRLDREDVAELLRVCAGNTPPAEFVELVYAETEGNPFFVEEVYRNLAESERLFANDGSFRSDINIGDVAVPPGVRLVLEQRLERVTVECRRILMAAAVSGRHFRFELLLRITDGGEDAVLDALDEAEAASLVEDVSTGREARYQFAHELIRQTLLSGLSFPRRQRLHLRIGEALESLFGESRASEIAHHYYQAGAAADVDVTVDFLRRAGRRTLSSLAFEDALRQLEQALEVIPENALDVIAEIEIMRAKALRGAARVDDALAVLAGALGNNLRNNLEHNVEPKLSDELYEQLRLERARLLVELFRGADALPDIEVLLDRAKLRADQATELEAEQLLAEAQYRISLDDPEAAEPAREATERAIELARKIGDRRALAVALLASTHFVDYWKDYRPQALRNLEEARDIGIELADEDMQIDAATMSLRVNIFTPVEWEIASEEILERLVARRDPIRLNQHLFWMMGPTRQAGHFERSVEVCDWAIEVAAQLGVAPIQYPTFKGMALLELGRFDEAWRAIEAEPNDEQYRFARALQAFGFFLFRCSTGAVDQVLTGALELLIEVHALRRAWMIDWLVNLVAKVGAQAGKIAATEQFLERAFELTGARPRGADRAELELARGDADAALERALRESQYCETHGLPVRNVEAMEVVCRALGALGRWQEVVERAEEIIRFADQCKFARMQWRLYALRARAYEALGQADQANADRAQGRAIFTRIAATIEDSGLKGCYQSQAAELGLIG